MLISRKAQEVVLRELFYFMMGIMVMIGIVFIFNTSISTNIKEFSINEQSYAMLNHVNSLLEKSAGIAESISNSTVSLRQTLPSKISTDSYRIYFENNQLCINTRGRLLLPKCINTTVNANIEGNYLSGTEIVFNINVNEQGTSISFDNYIPSYIPYFYRQCAGSTVVNWNNSFNFLSTDTMTCGCQSRLSYNEVLNPDFDEELISWDVIPSHASQVASVNYTDYYTSPAIFMQSNYANPGVHFRIEQEINPVDNLTIHYYGRNNSMSFSSLSVGVNTPEKNTSILYMLFGGVEFLGYCGTTQGSSDSFYINCLEPSEPDVWNSITVNPIQDLEKYCSLSINNYSKIVVGARISGVTNLLIDDFIAEKTSNGLYCDKNNDGMAEGVCYSNACVNTYLKKKTSPDAFFPNENPVITHELINFNESATCTVNINSQDYSMNVYSDTVTTTLPITLSKGTYLINITCISDALFTQSYNTGIVIIKHNWTIPSGIEDVSNNRPFTLGEFLIEHEGMELIIPDSNYNNRSANFFSSNAYYITRINNTEFTITMTLLEDINQDGYNELIITDDSFLYSYDRNLNQLWKSEIYSPRSMGIAIAEINSSFNGPEIIVNSHDLHVFNSTGGLIWRRQGTSPTSYPSYMSALSGPVIDDINIDNSGLEILFEDSDRLVMFSSTNDTLHEFIKPGRTDFFVWPAVADVNATSPGKEIAYVTNKTPTTMTLYLLNSSLQELWHHDYYWGERSYDGCATCLNPMSVIIGDVTGDGSKEILLTLLNTTGGSSLINDKLLIFSSSGNLITSYDYRAKYAGSNTILLELDSTNPGLEILSLETGILRVMNYLGQTLDIYSFAGGDASPFVLADDIDNDGMLEFLVFDYLDMELLRIESYTSQVNNKWTSFRQNNKGTGYQD